MKRFSILLIGIVAIGLVLSGCTQSKACESAIVALPPTTQYHAMPTPRAVAAGPGVSGNVFQVQISPEQIFPKNLNISVGDTVVFANMNQYMTKTLEFDDGYPAMRLRFQQRANRTFSTAGRYTYRDALKREEAEINVR